MTSSKTLYEGKAKKIIKGPKKDTLIQIFKDDATAYNKKSIRYLKAKESSIIKFLSTLWNSLKVKRFQLILKKD